MGAGDDEGTKEFEPSQQKLKQLREKGNIPKSTEVNQLLPFITAIVLIFTFKDFIWQKLYGMFYNLFYKGVQHGLIDEIGRGFIFKNSAEVFLMIVLPILLIVGFSAMMGDVMQVGFILTPNKIGSGWNRLNPVTNVKEIFTVKKLVELLRQLAKLAVLSIVAYNMVKKHWLEILTLTYSESVEILIQVFLEILKDFVINSSIILFVIAVIDYAYQRFDFMQKNRMTRKQMMDEYKQNEGDPYMKQQRRAMARRYAQGQQAILVPEADFITTNPTKIAVAIKYESGKWDAPKVIAKGSDAFAWQIIQIAERHDIPVIENVPLARALFKLVRLGQDVPPTLYRAVAEILLFVYQLKKKTVPATFKSEDVNVRS